MPLEITGTLTSTIVEHVGGALPVNTRVPSTRETLEALGNLQHLVQTGSDTLLTDNELVSKMDCFETIRRFILTR